MILRILEPELMDSDEDAHQYDAMDHAAVNAQFVSDLLEALTDWSLQRPVQAGATLHILDLGAGTAQIPIELARRAPTMHVTAVDAAESMLALARKNIAAAGLNDRIDLVLADAKNLSASAFSRDTQFSRDAEARRSGARFNSTSFPVVISNSIMHHIAEPRQVIAEALRVTAPGGLLFHRDLARPRDDIDLHELVTTYAGDATPYQRKLFADSLRAALTLDEMRELVTNLGFEPETCRASSDRHWTWAATKL